MNHIDLKILNRHGEDSIGYLSYFQSHLDFDFDIKRIYFTYAVPYEATRGFHAHKKLKQAIWCPCGCVEVSIDNGIEKEKFLLDSPEKLLIMNRGYWRELEWKEPNSVLCVAASDYYDIGDYIKDYDTFINLAQEGFWEDEC